MIIRLLTKLLINSFIVYGAASLLPGIHVDGFMTALVVSIVLGLVNTFIKPLLIFLTLPVTIITLGLFIFVINGLLVLLVDSLIPGFSVDNFLWALAFSLLLSIANGILFKLIK